MRPLTQRAGAGTYPLYTNPRQRFRNEVFNSVQSTDSANSWRSESLAGSFLFHFAYGVSF
jgi:hypothetical protein